jgi:hypothetical protein
MQCKQCHKTVIGGTERDGLCIPCQYDRAWQSDLTAWNADHEEEVIDRAIEADIEDGVKPGPRSAYKI